MKHRTVMRGASVQKTNPVTAMSVCLALREPIPRMNHQRKKHLTTPGSSNEAIPRMIASKKLQYAWLMTLQLRNICSCTRTRKRMIHKTATLWSLWCHVAVVVLVFRFSFRLSCFLRANLFIMRTCHIRKLSFRKKTAIMEPDLPTIFKRGGYDFWSSQKKLKHFIDFSGSGVSPINVAGFAQEKLNSSKQLFGIPKTWRGSYSATCLCHGCPTWAICVFQENLISQILRKYYWDRLTSHVNWGIPMFKKSIHRVKQVKKARSWRCWDADFCSN